MDIIIGLIAFALVLGVIVTVHELGHFLAAKRFGVFCGEFSIGMGPVICKKQGKETQYSLRLFPIGGFVSMAGEEDDTKKEIEVPYERTINGIKPWKKVIVMSAGIIMNIILAWVIFIGIAMYQGVTIDKSEAILTQVVENSPAEAAGLKVGDKIVALTGEDGKKVKITAYDQISEEINLNPQTYIFHVERDSKMKDFTITPVFDEENRSYRIGVGTTGTLREIEWYEAFGVGTEKMIDNSTLIFKSLGNLARGKNLNQLSGPVGIYEITKEAFQTNIIVYIQLFAILSLNIGIFNAIPIPILDGGRVVIIMLEKLLGRSINEKILDVIMYIGLFMLLALMLYATWNDILRMF